MSTTMFDMPQKREFPHLLASGAREEVERADTKTQRQRRAAIDSINEPPRPGEEPVRDKRKVIFVREECNRLLGLPVGDRRTVFANPVSLERRHFDALKAQPYMVACKDDGVAFAMLLSRWPKAIDPRRSPFCVMFDRNVRNPKVYEVCVLAAPVFFDGTLIYGELVWEYVEPNPSPLQTYIVHDVAALRGKPMWADSYFHRYTMLKTVTMSDSTIPHRMDTHKWMRDYAPDRAKEGMLVCAGNAWGLAVRHKTVTEAVRADTMWRLKDRLGHGADGLILTPNHEPIKQGTHWTLFKFKPREHHTIDLEVTGRYRELSDKEREARAAQGDAVTGVWSWKLAFQDQGERVRADEQHPFQISRETGGVLQGFWFTMHVEESTQLHIAMRKLDARKLERCRFIGEFSIAFPDGFDYEKTRSSRKSPVPLACRLTRLRGDKGFANNHYTVERTLINIVENIDLDEIMSILARQSSDAMA